MPKVPPARAHRQHQRVRSIASLLILFSVFSVLLPVVALFDALATHLPHFALIGESGSAVFASCLAVVLAALVVHRGAYRAFDYLVLLGLGGSAAYGLSHLSLLKILDDPLTYGTRSFGLASAVAAFVLLLASLRANRRPSGSPPPQFNEGPAT